MPPRSTHLISKNGAAAGDGFQAKCAAGVRCLRGNRFAEAIEHLSEALRLKPNDATALSSLGLALAAVGRSDQALAAYDQAAIESPGSAAIHYNRGNVLRSLGRGPDAIGAYDRALALEPSFAEALTNRGNTLREMNDEEGALSSYDRALAINPRLVEALFNKATLLNQMGRHLDALAAFDKALMVDSRSAEGYLMRGQIAARLGRTREALADFTKATRADPKNAIAHTLRGDQLVALGQSEEALKCFERAAEFDPDLAEAHDRLGLVLVEMGRLDEARLAHERAVSLSPEAPGFYHNLTIVSKLKADDPTFIALKRLAKDVGSLAPDEAIPLHFALAKAYADQENFKVSHRHLREGNSLKRARIEYDERATLTDLMNIRAIFNPSLLAEHRGCGDPSPLPVFVLGMPRSGSTLIEQILASHPKVHGAGEISDFVAAAVAIAGDNLCDLRADDADAETFRSKLRRIGASYVERIRPRHPGAERIVNKMPDNFRLAGLIHLALPNARIIHTRRNALDTCLSCYSKLFSGDISYSYDPGELGRYYRAYDALMAHWRALLPQHVLLEVDYESVVADPGAHARRIVEHCGLDWDSRCLDFHRNARPVRTASAVEVRKPIHADAVARWTKFGAELAPLIAALGPSAPEMPVAKAGERLLDRLGIFGRLFRRSYARQTAF